MASADWDEQLAEMTVLDAVYGLDESFVCVPPLAPTPPPPGTAFAGEVCVSVDLPTEGVWVCSDGVAPPAADASGATLWDARRVRVHHLPPIVLSFQLPPGYPSQDAPRFRLRCQWLSEDEVRGAAPTLTPTASCDETHTARHACAIWDAVRS